MLSRPCGAGRSDAARDRKFEVAMKSFTVLLIALMLPLAACHSSPRLHVKRPAHQGARMENGHLIVEGRGRPSTAADNPEQARFMAMRAATLDAQRNTLRFLGLAERIHQGSVEYERIEGVVKGARVLSEEWSPRDGAFVRLRIPLNGPGSLAEGLGYEVITIKGTAP